MVRVKQSLHFDGKSIYYELRPQASFSVVTRDKIVISHVNPSVSCIERFAILTLKEHVWIFLYLQISSHKA